MKHLSEINQRFCLLINLMAGGSQRQFAEIISCSPSVVAKIARGDQEPGKIVINRIGKIASINSNWFRTGKGKPLHYLPAEAKFQVPISRGLIPGAPAKHRDSWTGKTIVVPESVYRDSLHAVQAQNCVWGTQERPETILPEDMILIETATQLWHNNLGLLNGKLGVVAFGSKEKRLLKLCTLFLYEQDSLQIRINNNDTLSSDRKQRRIDLDPPASSSDTDSDTITESVSLNQIVGLTIQLIRDL